LPRKVQQRPGEAGGEGEGEASVADGGSRHGLLPVRETAGEGELRRPAGLEDDGFPSRAEGAVQFALAAVCFMA
jgi:hypothetical protein